MKIFSTHGLTKKGIYMGSKVNLKAMEVRLHKLKNNGKNFDSPGVVNKLERQIRNLKEKGEDE